MANTYDYMVFDTCKQRYKFMHKYRCDFIQVSTNIHTYRHVNVCVYTHKLMHIYVHILMYTLGVIMCNKVNICTYMYIYCMYLLCIGFHKYVYNVLLIVPFVALAICFVPSLILCFFVAPSPASDLFAQSSIR